MVQKELLFLAHRIPYPPNKGDKIRSFNELKYLSERGWRVHLCALVDDTRDLQHLADLKRYCATIFLEPISPTVQKLKSILAPIHGLPLSVPCFYSRTLQRRVDSILTRYSIECVVCFSGPMAEYVFRAARFQRSAISRQSGNRMLPHRPGGQPTSASASRPRLVMDLVDVDSDKWAQYAQWQKWPQSWVYRAESQLLARYEKRTTNTFDATIVVSPAEAEVLRRRVRLNGRIHAIGNGVDLEYFHPATGGQQSEINGQPEEAGLSDHPTADQPGGFGSSGLSVSQPPSLVFCGAMDYFPNVDAVCWFVREVFPLILTETGTVRFSIVGSNPTEQVRSLNTIPGVEVTGRVDDVRPYVWAADVSVASIRVARGVQNKVLEAMAMGKPVVATPEAFEGIECEPGRDLCVAKAHPETFARSVVDLLQDPDKAAHLGEHAREAVSKKYRWESRLANLEELLQDQEP